jgi:hypothetical protein
MKLEPLWTRRTEARLTGLSYAREAGLVLAWDVGQRLTLWDRSGQRQAQTTLLVPPVVAAISDDGSQIAAAGPNGEIWWLDPDLKFQFDLTLKSAPLALALDPLGDYLAVSGRERRTHLFNRLGKELAAFETARPLHHLVFVPSQARILGAADYGFIGCFEASGRCLWRDSPLTHVGSLSCDGTGSTILLACFSQGLRWYDHSGKLAAQVPTETPCRRADISFDGDLVLAASESASLSLLNRQGRVLETLATPQNVAALVLGALGEMGVFGLPTGDVTAVSIQRNP